MTLVKIYTRSALSDSLLSYTNREKKQTLLSHHSISLMIATSSPRVIMLQITRSVSSMSRGLFCSTPLWHMTK